MAKTVNTEKLNYIAKLEKWIEERKKDWDYSLEQFDKLIITLSSGGLILTIGFVRDIVKITEETDTTLLKGCWYLLTIALVLNLLSQVTSFFSNRLEIRYTLREIKSLKEQGAFNDKCFKNRFTKIMRDISNHCTIWCNILSFVVLIIGFWLFVVFINKNL